MSSVFLLCWDEGYSDSDSVLQNGLGHVKRRVGVSAFRLFNVRHRRAIYPIVIRIRGGVSVLSRDRYLGYVTPFLWLHARIRVNSRRLRFAVFVLARVGGLISRPRRGVRVLVCRFRWKSLLENRIFVLWGLFRQVNGRDGQDARVVEGVHGRSRFNVDHLFRLLKRTSRLITLFLRLFLLAKWLRIRPILYPVHASSSHRWNDGRWRSGRAYVRGRNLNEMS